jgi:phosphopantothenoylcysteine decarboxylase/phosphopantothenate--cysteine ligase
MARILITSGPTRQYLDPVRYLTNASSGRMGRALAQAALARGHAVVVVSGPVAMRYPAGAEVVPVITTEEMLAACLREFPRCDGVIGVAAPCDYRPVQVEDRKIAKSGGPLLLKLVETPDVVATLGGQKEHQWIVGFALETDDHHFRAVTKLQSKKCDLMVLNRPEAIGAASNAVEVLDPSGQVVASLAGPKARVAAGILELIDRRLAGG